MPTWLSIDKGLLFRLLVWDSADVFFVAVFLLILPSRQQEALDAAEPTSPEAKAAAVALAAHVELLLVGVGMHAPLDARAHKVRAAFCPRVRHQYPFLR